MLVVAHRDDPVEEVQFSDGRVFKAGHGSVLFYHEGNVIYMAVPLRNAGPGVAYLQGYRPEAEPAPSVQADPLGPARHRRGEAAPEPIPGSQCSNATCTSRPARTVSGRQPSAIPLSPPTPLCRTLSALSAT